MYYHLSRARQGRRIRDVVLVRLEQIAPFPHDLVGKVKLLSHTAACPVRKTLHVTVAPAHRACIMAGSSQHGEHDGILDNLKCRRAGSSCERKHP